MPAEENNSTCCVHVARVGVCEEGQEVVSAASHVLSCPGTQLLHTRIRLRVNTGDSGLILLSQGRRGGNLHTLAFDRRAS